MYAIGRAMGRGLRIEDSPRVCELREPTPTLVSCLSILYLCHLPVYNEASFYSALTLFSWAVYPFGIFLLALSVMWGLKCRCEGLWSTSFDGKPSNFNHVRDPLFYGNKV